MKLKTVVTLTLFLFSSTFINAQMDKNLEGHYHEKTQENFGENYFIFENHTFTIVAYATLIQGNWTIDDKNIVTLQPNNPEQPFILFGRYNPNIKSGIKIMFNNFSEGDTFIGFDDKDSIQDVFNYGANCLKFPYVYQFNKKINQISFKDEKAEIFTFKLENNFNDFIVEYIEDSKFLPPFKFIATKDGLQSLKNGKNMSKNKINKETLLELNEIGSQPNPIFQKVIYRTLGYNIISLNDNDLSKYQFDEFKNAYTDKIKYQLDEELTKQENEFHNYHIVYKYDKVDLTMRISDNEFKINRNSLFIATCDK